MNLVKHAIWITLALSPLGLAQVDPPSRVGRISFVQGSVSFQPAGIDDWGAATLNRPLTTGDHIWVDRDSRSELQLGTAAVRLGAGTAFEFLNLDDQAAQIRLAQGSLEVRVRSLGENEIFEIDTPNLAFSVLRPGTYRVDVNPDTETTLITTRGGEGEVTGAGQAFPVHPREQARVTGGQQISYNLGPATPPDWFDDWCSARERQHDNSITAHYVSRDMIGYADLDQAGQWQPEPEYGNVWFPRAVPANWAPYRNGHWAWIEPWGWTWVDDAPWGFAPFHYGRWAQIRGTWGWIPGPPAARPVYAPALVAWVGGPHFSVGISAGGVGAGVGWFPLAPREVYVPSYHVSEAYVTRVNVSNTVVNNVTVVNVYRNTNVTNIRYINQTAPGVTVVSRESFVKSEHVGRARVEVAPQALASATVVRTAAFVPTRENLLGHTAVVTTTAHPPAAVFTRAVVAKVAPPPPPVTFVQRQQMLQRNPGQPVPQADVQRIRAQAPQPERMYVRQVNPAQVQQARPVMQVTPPSQQPPPAAPQNLTRPNSPNPTNRVEQPRNEPRPLLQQPPTAPQVQPRLQQPPPPQPVTPNPLNRSEQPAPQVQPRLQQPPPAQPVTPNPLNRSEQPQHVREPRPESRPEPRPEMERQHAVMQPLPAAPQAQPKPPQPPPQPVSRPPQPEVRREVPHEQHPAAAAAKHEEKKQEKKEGKKEEKKEK